MLRRGGIFSEAVLGLREADGGAGEARPRGAGPGPGEWWALVVQGTLGGLGILDKSVSPTRGDAKPSVGPTSTWGDGGYWAITDVNVCIQIDGCTVGFLELSGCWSLGF